MRAGRFFSTFYSQLSAVPAVHQQNQPRFTISRISSETRNISLRYRATPFKFTFRCYHSASMDNPSPSILPEFTYHPEPDVENLEEYRPGGYHPAVIGDTFCSDRYTIVHKLGFGGYSTIWLARDRQYSRYVSLKILAARVSQESREAEILHLLMKGDAAHVGKQFIPQLLDQFFFDGPNGHHRCLVGEPAGCSVARSKEDSTNLMFPPNAARSTAAQLIMGLSYLHENDVCHGGKYICYSLCPFRPSRLPCSPHA